MTYTSASNGQSINDVDLPEIKTVESPEAEEFNSTIRPHGEPVVMKGLVRDWPSVAHGKASRFDLAAYLKRMDVGATLRTFIAPPEAKGRYFYTDDMRRFTFEERDVPVSAVIEKLIDQSRGKAGEQGDEQGEGQGKAGDPIGIYAGASPTRDALPAFGGENPMTLLEADAAPKIWIGNSSRVAPHFDTSENIACVVSGTRRFVVFPPDQIANLYVGPIDYNMAGQPASLVDVDHIDLERFPKFKEALKHARIATLEPGDAIYIPSLWWHCVEAQGSFNVLVNYWWGDQANGSPMNVLALALLAIRDLPKNDRAAWESVFHHYIFDAEAASAVDHIPEAFHGVLGKASPKRDAKIKGFLRAQMGRLLM